MKKKILGIFVFALIIAIFALPINSILAMKPEPILFFGYPTLGVVEAEIHWAGQSDNQFMIWKDLPWTFCWAYTPVEVAPGVFIPVSIDDLATGV